MKKAWSHTKGPSHMLSAKPAPYIQGNPPTPPGSSRRDESLPKFSFLVAEPHRKWWYPPPSSPSASRSSWTFAGHELASYRIYRDVKHTVRKLLIRSTILDGQTLDLSSPRMSYKRKTDFMEKSDFRILRKNCFEPMNPYNF